MSNPYHYPPHPLLPLHILTTELVRLHDVAAVSEVTLTATALMFNARAAALWLVDPDEGVLCLLNRRGARECAWPDSLPLDADHPLVDVVRNRATVYIPDTSIAPHCIFHDQPSPHAQLAVPLMVGARPLGVLYLDHAQVAPFGEQERMLLDTMANTAAIVLENALLFEKAHQAEARYRAIAELTSDYAYSIRVEPGGVLVTESATESISRVTGFTSQELDAHGWAVLIHPDDRPIALRRVASLPPGKADVSEFRIVTRTGETRYVRDHRRPVWDEVQQRVVRIDGAAQDITERKRAEEALARLSRHNELILNSAGEGIFGLDGQGRHTFVNAAAARMLGYEVEELVGQRSHPVWHHSRPDGRPYPDDECPIYAAYRDGVTHEGTDDVFWRKDGTCFPVEYISTPIREEGELAGAVVVFRDVTERKRAEEALARLSHYNELILNSAGEGIFGLDAQGRHTFVNVAAARMLGYEVKELIGELSHPIWHHSKSDGSPFPIAECPMDAAYRDGIVHRVADEVFWRKDGTSFPVEYVSTPIHERGQLIGAVVVFKDITERRRAEQQAILAERMAALGRLAAALAHEINNPLQAIQSHLELVMDFPLEPDEYANYLRIIRQEIERLRDITQRVLNFARPALAPRRWVSVADLLRQTLTLAGKQLQHCHCQVTTDLRETPLILATPEQLIQVFLNLIINAVEATHENGHIHVEARVEGDRVVIAFANDGRPIPLEHLPHIFEPFYTTKPDGTGLGLSVSHSLVRQHGGALAVENMPTERGVVFTVTLPIPGAGPSLEAQA